MGYGLPVRNDSLASARRSQRLNRIVAQSVDIEFTRRGAFQDLQRDRFGIDRVGWLDSEGGARGLVRVHEDRDLFGRIGSRRRKSANGHRWLQLMTGGSA